ncbi:MAG: filamentous hemagglutinin N-terminal domain-containing protein [Parachlamydiales bacterium]|nr:filamentous hemagglutinin N-terminal domain-containing protein [Parachlamydiales bacterium]
MNRAFFLLFPCLSWALPQSYETISGTCESRVINPEVIELIVSDGAFLEWKHFSIEENETARFLQPHAEAVALNRVISADPSRLMGRLEANGQLVLINPNGIVFGKDSIIDTTSLIASTFDVLGSDYLQKNSLEFKIGSLASIENLGSICANTVYLVGSEIKQNGMIQAPQFAGIIAGRATFEKNFLQSALALPNEEGRVFISGKIDSNDVLILGNSISLLKMSQIDASGDFCGGRVRIGGDWQGIHGTLFGSQETNIADSALIVANARESGNGGSIIVWSDGTTQFHGNIEALGGKLAGNGGKIEVSGKKNLDFGGTASAKAPLGKTGTLLLDPPDITIQVAGATTGTFSPCAPPSTYTPGIAADILTVASLTGALAGCNVVVDAATGNITVASAISWLSGNSLTLTASQNITVNASITPTASGASIFLNAGQNITVTNAEVANIGPAPGAAVSAIAATGNILIQSSSANARIGNQFGNILVEANAGNVICQMNNSGVTNRVATIGSFSPTVLGDPLGNVGDQIVVRAGNDILLNNGNPNSPSGCYVGISRVGAYNNDTGSVNGDFFITARRDIYLNGTQNGGTNRATAIGPGAAGATARAMIGNIEINAGRDLVINTGRGGSNNNTFIGSFGGGAPGESSIIINTGRNLTMQPMIPTLSGNFGFIGNGGTGGAMKSTSIEINVGADMVMDGRQVSNLITPAYNTVSAIPPTMFIHVGGNVTIFGGVSAAATTRTAMIQLTQVDPSIAFEYELWAGGRIRCLNGTSTNREGSIWKDSDIAQARIDLRANGDLIGAGDETNLGTLGSPRELFVSADHCFERGDLWSAQTALVNGINVFQGTPLANPSPALPNNGVGGFALDCTFYDTTNWPVSVATAGTGTHNLVFRTGSGNITIRSSDTFQGDPFTGTAITSGTAANFNITGILPVPNNYGIVTTSGNIEISGPSGANCTGLNSFNNVSVAAGSIANPWTSGSIYISANNNLSISDDIVTTGSQPISLIADYNDTGTGILTINPPVSLIQSNGGPILLDSGFDSPGGSSSIVQNSGLIDSNGGPITFQSAGNIFVSGAALAVDTDGGFLSITSTNGTIQIDRDMETLIGTGGADISAGIDVIFTPAGGSLSTGSGSINITAGNNIVLNGDPTTLNSATGNIGMTAGNDIEIYEVVNTGSGNISSLAENNTTLFTSIGSPLVSTSGMILMITGNNMSLLGTSNITSTGNSVTLVVDNDFPAMPLIGGGIFTMGAGTQVNSGSGSPIRIFTALQQNGSANNQIAAGALLNGFSPFSPPFNYPGTLFANTAYEIWCTYYSNNISGSPFPGSLVGGFPFTIFYKNCLQQVVEQAMIVVTELLRDFEGMENPNFPYHGLNEYYGWPSKFIIFYDLYSQEAAMLNPNPERYFIRRKNELLVVPHRERRY